MGSVTTTGEPLGRSIGRTHKLVRAWGDRALAEVDSSVTEWIVLFNIGRAAAPGASQVEIARFSDMGSPALVRHIDRLEADGLVARTRDVTDRRTVRLTLTPEGRRRLEALRRVITRTDGELRSVLTDDEAVVMQRALDKLFVFCVSQLHGERAAAAVEPTAPIAGELGSTGGRRNS